MKRLLSVFLTVLLMTCLLSSAALADWHSFSCEVNEYINYVFTVPESIDYLNYASGTVPPGVSVEIVNDTDYRISGTPTAAGVFQFAYNVGHGDSELTENITITVDASSSQTGSSPTVTKSPSDDSVHVGDSVLFIAKADNAEGYSWYISLGGVDYSMPDALYAFPDLSVSGDGTERLTLSNVPSSLQNASVYCIFTNAYGSVRSGAAKLYVLDPLPSEKPTASPDAVTPTPAASAVPTAHVHSFSALWSSDNDTHWHACECVERADEAAHAVSSWEIESDGSQTGICSVCGAVVTKAAAAVSPTPTPVPARKGLSSNGLILLLILLLIILFAAALFLFIRSRRVGTAQINRRENRKNGPYNPRHDGLHDEEDRAAYYREQLRDYENRNRK